MSKKDPNRPSESDKPLQTKCWVCGKWFNTPHRPCKWVRFCKYKPKDR